MNIQARLRSRKYFLALSRSRKY